MKSGFLTLLITLSLAANAPAVDLAKEGIRSTVQPDARATTRLQWNRKTLVTAYDQVGKHSPKWDKDARHALESFAEARTYKLTVMQPPYWEAAHSAVTNGCNDPEIRYLNVRYLEWKKASGQQISKEFAELLVDMNQSSYPAIRKFGVDWRAADYLGDGLRPKATDYLIEALSDKTLPIEEVDEIVSEVINKWQYSSNLAPFYFRAQTNLLKNWPDDSQTWLLKGTFYVKYAWLARGYGYSDTISDVGGHLFAERLEEAQTALLKAWELNPKDERIAIQMIDVELGQGKGRDRMETWFARAMKLNTNCYEACRYKMNYLEPKWYGSARAMLEFGRECVANTNWGPYIPLMLVDAHERLANYLSATQKLEYWKNPMVWGDIRRAYETFFARCNDVSYRHNYARYAYWAEDWDELNRQIPLLGPINYNYFGGKMEYDRMVIRAKEHEKKD